MSDRTALFLHGAGGGGWEWRIWSETVRAHAWYVRAPDLARTDGDASSARWEDHLAAVHRELDAAGAPCVVIGASLGGLLALAVAPRASALVLINPLPPAPWHGGLPAREWPDVVPWGTHARLASTRRAMPDADEASMLFAFRHWRDESGAVMRQATGGIALPAPECPCLVIAAREDADVPAAIARTMSMRWNSTLWEVDGGHLSPLMGRQASALAA